LLSVDLSESFVVNVGGGYGGDDVAHSGGALPRRCNLVSAPPFVAPPLRSVRSITEFVFLDEERLSGTDLS